MLMQNCGGLFTHSFGLDPISIYRAPIAFYIYFTTKKQAFIEVCFFSGYDLGLDAGFAIFLTEFLEGEGGLADACACGLVVYLVDVFLDSSDLLLDLSDNSFHDNVV